MALTRLSKFDLHSCLEKVFTFLEALRLDVACLTELFVVWIVVFVVQVPPNIALSYLNMQVPLHHGLLLRHCEQATQVMRCFGPLGKLVACDRDGLTNGRVVSKA